MGKIVKRVALFIVSLLLPITLIFSIDGNYYFNLTSKETLFYLFDSTIQQQLETQIEEYQRICVARIGKRCSTLNETIETICGLSKEIEENVTSQILSICSSINLTCTNISDAVEKICNTDLTDICSQVIQAQTQISNIKGACISLMNVGETLETQKREIYYRPIMGKLSLAKLHESLKYSSIIGIILSAFLIFITFFATRSFILTLKYIFYAFIVAGIALWMPKLAQHTIFSRMGESISNALNSLPPILEFVTSILEHEALIGKTLLLIGIPGLLFVFILSYFRKKVTRE